MPTTEVEGRKSKVAGQEARRQSATVYNARLILRSAARSIERAIETADVAVLQSELITCTTMIESAREVLSRELPALAAVAAQPVPAAGTGVPAGYECMVTAHPEGGYALLWADHTRTGKYFCAEDAAKDAGRNGYNAFNRFAQSKG